MVYSFGIDQAQEQQTKPQAIILWCFGHVVKKIMLLYMDIHPPSVMHWYQRTTLGHSFPHLESKIYFKKAMETNPSVEFFEGYFVISLRTALKTSALSHSIGRLFA